MRATSTAHSIHMHASDLYYVCGASVCVCVLCTAVSIFTFCNFVFFFSMEIIYLNLWKYDVNVSPRWFIISGIVSCSFFCIAKRRIWVDDVMQYKTYPTRKRRREFHFRTFHLFWFPSWVAQLTQTTNARCAHSEEGDAKLFPFLMVKSEENARVNLLIYFILCPMRTWSYMDEQNAHITHSQFTNHKSYSVEFSRLSESFEMYCDRM